MKLAFLSFVKQSFGADVRNLYAYKGNTLRCGVFCSLPLALRRVALQSWNHVLSLKQESALLLWDAFPGMPVSLLAYPSALILSLPPNKLGVYDIHRKRPCQA